MNAVMLTKTPTAPLGAETATVPGVPVEWRRGLVCPDRVHVAETEDGVPRTMTVGSGTVVIATCQAWLDGEPVTAGAIESRGWDRCSTCATIADAVLADATGTARNPACAGAAWS